MSVQKPNPYVGLRPFKKDESILFFGRKEQILELLKRLHSHHFVAVVGGSGSGKSSLIRAGLIPALKGGFLVEDSDNWLIASMKPGQDPLSRLAKTILRELDLNNSNKSISTLVEKLKEEGDKSILDIIEPIWIDKKYNFFLLVDQFEELFRIALKQTDVEKRDEAREFVNIILELSQQQHIPFHVVITMRSDFIGDCDQFYGLPEAMNRSQFLVSKLNRIQLKRAIEGPAKLCGKQISPSLTSRLINDLNQQKDGLPLLQHALNRTWVEWEKSGNSDLPIDLVHYKKIGTMSDALDKHADEAYEELKTDRAKYICEKMFKALADVDTEGRRLRHPTKLGDLCKIIEATKEELIEVIDVFRIQSRSFLMPPADYELTSEDYIDISHESLMRIWKKLIEWTDEEQESVRTYRRLTDATIYYENDHEGLLEGPFLSNVLNWEETHKPNASWAERYNKKFQMVNEYLKESKEKWQQEKQENEARKEAKRQAELNKIKEKQQAERKKRLIKRRWLVGLFTFTTVVLLTIGFIQYRNLENIKLLNDVEKIKVIIISANSIIDQVRLIGEKDPTRAFQLDTAALLSLRSVYLHMDSLRKKTYRFNSKVKKKEHKNLDSIYHLTHSLINAQADSILKKDNALYIIVKPNNLEDTIFDIRFVNGIFPHRTIDSSFRVWHAEKHILDSIKNHGNLSQVVFPLDSLETNEAMALYKNGTAHYWGTKKYYRELIMEKDDSITSIAPIQYKRIGFKMLSAMNKKRIVQWNLNGKKRFSIKKRFRKKGPVIYSKEDIQLDDIVVSIAISPNRAKIFTASNEGMGIIWAADTSEVTLDPAAKKAFNLHQDTVICSAFSNNGLMIVTGSKDHTVKIWNAENGDLVKVLNGHTGPITSVAFSAHDSLVYTGSMDRTFRQWRLPIPTIDPISKMPSKPWNQTMSFDSLFILKIIEPLKHP